MDRRKVRIALLFLYCCAALQFIRFYCKTTIFYLHMSDYLTGKERLPFQFRVLPILVFRPFYASASLRTFFTHSHSLFSVESLPFYLLSLLAFGVSSYYAYKLYNALTVSGLLRVLVLPIFLFTVMWTYAIHLEANFSYPYDLPSVAFFVAGLYYIYMRRFVPLFFILLLGTFNRETTLFLIGIYVLDGATTERSDCKTFNLRQVAWARVALLALVWASIKLTLHHLFAGNDRSEDFLRFEYNLTRLQPRLVPALLNICGYTLPVVVLFFNRLQPRRFANYLYILPIWFAVMFAAGVLLETRIYGELCSYSAIALVLILEQSIEEHFFKLRPPSILATTKQLPAV